MFEWEFDGTGDINGAGVWMQTGTGVTVTSAGMQYNEIQDGRRVPNAAGNINEAFASETWDTKNQ